MKVRVLIAGLLAILIAGVAVVAASAEGEDDEYLVRAVFDSSSFIGQDMDVRIGGANVGYVDDVDVSMPGETVSLENGGQAIPGKAVIILRITEPGFRDFRSDASCIIRPQSLIGEKFIECRPTVPRRPEVEPPPSLPQIEDGERGEGQYLLPLENNGRMVDFDLVNNIMRRPYSERFRLILNELGGAFAARGGDIAEIVERANPTLREVNRVFGILAQQRNRLAKLTVESDQVLRPLARERRRVVGFMRSSGEAAEASAEHRAQISESLRKLPEFLREFRETMSELGGFAEAGTPVARDLRTAAPSFTDATVALAPFSEATTTAIESLGEAGEQAGPLFEESLPAVRSAAALARTGEPAMFAFSSFLTSTRRTGGFEGLMDVIYNLTAVMNAYDSYGHFARTLVVPTNCINYQTAPTTGCSANYRDFGFSVGYEEMIQQLYALMEEIAEFEDDEESGGVEPGARSGGEGDVPNGESGQAGEGDGSGEGNDRDAETEDPGEPEGGPADSSDGSGERSTGAGASADLLNYLLAP